MPLSSRTPGRIGALASGLLVQGGSPSKLALTTALGVVIGILPLPWGSTALCALLAYLLRLNQAGIQAANYLAWPLQIAFLVPFYRMGARLFPWGPTASPEEMVQRLGGDWGHDASLVLVATLKALAAWLLVTGPAAGLLYLVLLPVTTGMLRNRSAAS